MLDTNVFNHLADGKVEFSAFINRYLFVTHVQPDELNDTKDPVRRAKLCKFLQALAPEELATRGAIWDVSKWNRARWPEGALLAKMRPVVEGLDKKAHKRKKVRNQSCDLLIAATALMESLTLVTNDLCLRAVVQKFGGRAIDVAEFASAATNLA